MYTYFPIGADEDWASCEMPQDFRTYYEAYAYAEERKSENRCESYTIEYVEGEIL